MVIEAVENTEDVHRDAVLSVLIKEVRGGLAKLLLILVRPVEATKGDLLFSSAAAPAVF